MRKGRSKGKVLSWVANVKITLSESFYKLPKQPEETSVCPEELRGQVTMAGSAQHHPPGLPQSKAQQARLRTSSKATGGQEHSRHAYSLPTTTAAALYL